MHETSSIPVSDSAIEAALMTVARIVERYGEAYWPIFERLERELALRAWRGAAALFEARPPCRADLRCALVTGSQRYSLGD